MKFKVYVQRTTRQGTAVEVEAETTGEAQWLALEEIAEGRNAWGEQRETSCHVQQIVELSDDAPGS